MIQRKTIQCALVLEAVKQKHHITADEVYGEIKKKHPKIGRGTVYRNLQRLCVEGKIKKVEVPDGADRYDHICTQHYHIKCEKCGKLYDLNMPYLVDLEKSANELYGFINISHDIMFKGICRDCQKNKKENNL